MPNKSQRVRMRCAGWVVPAVLLAVAVTCLCCSRRVGFEIGWDSSARLAEYAKKYSKSVAFVVVEYWLCADAEKVLHHASFGTAFLADHEGRLLTNRHVACPWLEDGELLNGIERVRQAHKKAEFAYRRLVWFEGAAVLRRAQDAFPHPQLEDALCIEDAYTSDGYPQVALLGALQKPEGSGHFEALSLKDDVAVLQVAPVPKDIDPIPLLTANDPQPEMLSPVLALGFPLGIDALPEQNLVASATVGHIRRCFRHALQADVSLHPGNSGGPVLDSRGRVIGIASSVCRDQQDEHDDSFPSDMGNILPMECAARLLSSVVAGRPQWDGLIDPELDGKLADLFKLAKEGRWHEACLAENDMTGMSQERLLAGAVLRYGDGDLSGALARLKELQSVYPECKEGAFLQLLLTRHGKVAVDRALVSRLLSLDWRSPGEFYGYLARVLAGIVPLSATPDGGDDQKERALLDFVVGVMFADRRNKEMAEGFLRKAILAMDSATWQSALARFELGKLQNGRGEAESPRVYNTGGEVSAGDGHVRTSKKRSSQRYIDVLKRKLECAKSFEQYVRVLNQLVDADPRDIRYSAALAFTLAKEGKWRLAADACEAKVAHSGRESADRLGIGLFHAQLLLLAGFPDKATAALTVFRNTTTDPWYRDLSRLLLGEIPAALLESRCRDNPANQITLQTALGLQAEADKQIDLAIKHYGLALDSALDNWGEYELSASRVQKLRTMKAKTMPLSKQSVQNSAHTVPGLSESHSAP